MKPECRLLSYHKNLTYFSRFKKPLKTQDDVPCLDFRRVSPKRKGNINSEQNPGKTEKHNGTEKNRQIWGVRRPTDNWPTPDFFDRWTAGIFL